MFVEHKVVKKEGIGGYFDFGLGEGEHSELEMQVPILPNAEYLFGVNFVFEEVGSQFSELDYLVYVLLQVLPVLAHVVVQANEVEEVLHLYGVRVNHEEQQFLVLAQAKIKIDFYFKFVAYVPQNQLVTLPLPVKTNILIFTFDQLERGVDHVLQQVVAFVGGVHFQEDGDLPALYFVLASQVPVELLKGNHGLLVKVLAVVEIELSDYAQVSDVLINAEQGRPNLGVGVLQRFVLVTENMIGGLFKTEILLIALKI